VSFNAMHMLSVILKGRHSSIPNTVRKFVRGSHWRDGFVVHDVLSVEWVSESWTEALKFMCKVGMVANATHDAQLCYLESKIVRYLFALDALHKSFWVVASVLQWCLP
jgi:hypothetical protein